MFKVKSIETNNIYTVCGCQEIRGITSFLLHDGIHWIWTEAELFIPYEDIPFQPESYYDPMKPYTTWTSNIDTKLTE